MICPSCAEHPDHGTPDETVVFDYIYGVLHCPIFLDTYAVFLKSDFPRIPWPSSPEKFWHVSSKSGELRRLHLIESSSVGDAPYPFMGEGDNVVNTIDKKSFETAKSGSTNTQYFGDVPEIAWNFYICGYQPSQKWLKDRKNRVLSFDDVKHYQRIIKILTETDRIMADITMTLGVEPEVEAKV